MDEVELQGEPRPRVVRIGATVRRRPGWWTPAVHGLLSFLTDTGFLWAPTPLGFDDDGREVLSFIDGDSGRGALALIATDDGLAAQANLLREYHTAVATYRPPSDAEWACGVVPMTDNDIVCHGDFGAWNLVWDGGRPVGIIDWDLAYPGPPLDDVAYALAYSVPFFAAPHLDATGLTSPDMRRHRVKVFADAYGIAVDGLVDAVLARQRKYARLTQYLHDRGLRVPWTTTASIVGNVAAARWSEAHRNLFE